ncbi:MAG: FG-GAP repeat domain-containing protein, partial [Myxococcota bacterium]
DVDAPRGPSARAQARDGVDRASTGPDATWWATVAPRIAAEARAFRPDGATSFAARTPVLTARLGADGLTASARDGAELTLSFSAWGRAGAEIPVGVAAPALGDCVPGEQDARGACVRRVERAYGEVTEWWVSRAQGVQQGWDVAAPPAGDGPLTLVLAVDGADAEMAGDELVLVDTRGNTWTYGGLAAWDADGEPLPAWMTVGGDGRIVVSVDDTDARYPVVVDPLLTTAATTLTGPGTVVSTQLGETLATADVNGDGFADVVVGADNYLAGDGAVFVFHGAASGLGATAATRLDPPSTSPGAFGWNIADAGDVNGDGYDDVLVSGTSGGATEVVSVFHGSAAGLGASPSASLSASS